MNYADFVEHYAPHRLAKCVCKPGDYTLLYKVNVICGPVICPIAL